MTASCSVDAALANLAREHLQSGRTLRAYARGRSMWPAIRDGERVLIEPIIGAIRTGDIVLLHTQTGLVLHRVVSASDTHVRTRGDAVFRDDLPVPTTAVIGRVSVPAASPRRSGLLRALAAVRTLAPGGFRRISRTRQAVPTSRGRSVPPNVFDAMRYHLAGLALLHRATTALARDGIPVMPLKGIWLQVMVYASPVERPIRDVDVLVPPGCFVRAERTLHAHGFVRHTSAQTEAEYRLPGHPLALDLHRSLFTPFAFDMPAQDLFARARRADAQRFGCTLSCPDPLDVFAHLIGHFVKSGAGAEDEMHLRDFVEMGARLALDPEDCANHLQRTGLARAARLVLPLAASTHDDEFCRRVVDWLPPDPVGSALAGATRRSFSHPACGSRLRSLRGFALDASLPRGLLALAARTLDKAARAMPTRAPGTS